MRAVLLLLSITGSQCYVGPGAAPPSRVGSSSSAVPASTSVAPDTSCDTRLEVATAPAAEPKLGELPKPQPLDLWPKPTGSGGPRGPSVFKLNQGRAIDVLRHDYPRFFTEKPDLSIFADNLELHDPSGKRLQGKKQYERVFDALRFLRRTTMQDAIVTHRIVADDSTVRTALRLPPSCVPARPLPVHPRSRARLECTAIVEHPPSVAPIACASPFAPCGC